MSKTWSAIWTAAMFAAGAAIAANDFPSVGPGSAEHKALQDRCKAASSQEREQCMRDAEAADEKAGKHCVNLTLRARAQCLADARATQEQQSKDQAAGGAQSGANSEGLAIPTTAGPGEELKKGEDLRSGQQLNKNQQLNKK